MGGQDSWRSQMGVFFSVNCYLIDALLTEQFKLGSNVLERISDVWPTSVRWSPGITKWPVQWNFIKYSSRENVFIYWSCNKWAAQTSSRVSGVIPGRPVSGPGFLSSAMCPFSSRCVHVTLGPGAEPLFKAATLHHTSFACMMSRRSRDGRCHFYTSLKLEWDIKEQSAQAS